MYPRATLIILFCTLITFILWLLSIPALPFFAKSPLHYATQIAANLTVVFMGLSLVMSVRMQILEKIFGGLDKNYKFHALVGSLAFMFMVVHPLTLVADALFTNLDNLALGLSEAAFYLVPGTVLRANLGILAVYTVIFSFTFLTYLKLPYHHWLTTHRLLGLAFLLGSIHAYMAPSNLVRSPYLAIWIGFWIYLGLAAALYSIFLFRKFGPRYKYQIASLDQNGDIFNITLQPSGQKILFLPGQFMYIRFHNSKLGTEMHPFSASSAPDEQTLRFSIKALGDYTSQMDDLLKTGESAEVYGPYGNFGKTYLFDQAPMIWIGGGVGITPFLSMLHDLVRKGSDRSVLFYYSLNKPPEAVFDQEIITQIKNSPNVKYLKWIAESSGFLTGEKILTEFQSAFPQQSLPPKILLCGPPGMMHALHAQLRAKGIPDSHIIFEEFSFLS